MGTRWNRLREAVLTSTQNLCFVQKYEKYLSFLSENFKFLEIKFSIYLNRRVFVMIQKAPSEDSDQTAKNAQADLNLRWASTSEGTFFDGVPHFS